MKLTIHASLPTIFSMASQNTINSINMSRILRYIWLNRGTARVDISSALGLNKSTVTKDVQLLLDRRGVETLSQGESTPAGGRKPVFLGIREDFCYIMGVEIQTESYRAVITDARGRIVLTRNNRLKDPGTTLISQFEQTMEELAPFIVQYNVRGIGLGISGIVNPDKGEILRSRPFGITETLDFAKKAEDMAGLPVFLENDANCCCWGDLAEQKASREENMLFVLSEFRDIDTRSPGKQALAVGLGLVINGKVHHGRDYSAGEFTSFLGKGASRSQFSLGEEDLARLGEDETVLMTAVSELSANLALLINSLNISRVVIGGFLVKFQDLCGPILRQCIQESWAYENPVDCQVEFSGYGSNAVAFGAAGMVLEKLFGIPEVGSPLPMGWDLLQNLQIL